MTENVNRSIPIADALAALRAKMEEGRGGPTDNVITPGVCHWCHKDCGGTCLGVNHTDPLTGEEHGSRQMKTSDPAYWMLKDSYTTTPQVHRDGCYICEDKEFAAMGLPLCKPCPECMKKAENEGQMGHIPADDPVCDDCGYDEYAAWQEEREAKKAAGE